MNLEKKIDKATQDILIKKYEKLLNNRCVQNKGRDKYYIDLFADSKLVGDAELYFMMDMGDVEHNGVIRRGEWKNK